MLAASKRSTQFNELLRQERERLPLFYPVFLGFGIIFGVFIPFYTFKSLLCFLFTSLVPAFVFRKIYTLPFVIILFSTGVYVSQTGGIFETSLLSHKKFLEEEMDRVTFTADVEFIETSHPTMKNMQRIVFRNIEFQDADLKFIKRARMTIASSVVSRISVDDKVKIVCRLIPYKGAAIPMSFDQAQYNSLIKMDATGIVFSAENIKNTPSIGVDFFSRARMMLTNAVTEKMGKKAGGIGSALLTGDKSAISPDIREKFVNSGTAHILAISGLHMSLVASIFFFTFLKISLYLGFIFKKFNARRFAAFLTIAVTYLYLALSGFSPSATRAFIMTTIGLFGIILGKGAISLRSISIAALCMLIFDPASLFLVSFQLSFCAVTALISFYERYKYVFPKIIFNSKSVIKKAAVYITASSLTTIVASIATFPISVATFNRYSLSGILGNLVAIPLTSFIIIPLGIISIIFGKLTALPVKASETAINFLADCVGYISTIKGSNVIIRSPQTLTLYILIIGGIILCLLKTRLRHIGSLFVATSSVLWIFERGPNFIIPPNIDEACIIRDGKLLATSIRKGRNQFISIQRNLGLSGKIEKIEKCELPADCKIHERGLFLWINEHGEITKACTTAKKRHPFCPTTFQRIDIPSTSTDKK
jgi:competence protein ComEC